MFDIVPNWYYISFQIGLIWYYIKMLAFNKKTDYGIIALTCLATEPQRVISARRIAGLYGMRLPILMNVLKKLGRGGLVRSVRGSRGGYRLARAAKQISLAQMVRALEGSPRLVACAKVSASSEFSCDLAERCPVQFPVRKVHQRLMAFLEDISLADLAAGGSPKQVGAELAANHEGNNRENI